MRERFSTGTFTPDSMISCRTLIEANGYSQDDVSRPLIGIADSFTDLVPGHRNLRELTQQVKYGIYRAGGTPVEFGTIGVCDGVCCTHDGARYSLPSRDLVADSVEVMARAHRLDGLVLLAGCDKTVPGMLMAAARLDTPCVFVAGGPMLSGPAFGPKAKSDSTSIEEAYGMYQTGSATREELSDLELNCCPTIGSCQHMATANTMCCLAEGLGLSLPGSAAIPAVYNERQRSALSAGEACVKLVRRGITARDIVTPEALENAVRLLLACGGSTNAVIHLAALAHEIGLDPAWVLELIDEVGGETPLLVKINPSSLEHDAEDFYHAGGMPRVMQALASQLHLGCLTVTGQTVEDNLASYHYRYPADPSVITTLVKPFSTLPGIVVLHGNLAPQTAVAKPAAIAPEVRRFSGPARCFDSEAACAAAIGRREIKPGDVVVIRYEGPQGAPGMPEMFGPLKLLNGQGLARQTALITDGRFSGTNNGCFVGHISPEAAAGGPIALIEDGDIVTIDVVRRTLTLEVDDETIARRRAAWSYTPPQVDGYLRRYAAQASSANRGGVLGA